MSSSSLSLPPFLCPACGSAFNGTIIAQETLPNAENTVVAVQTCPTCGLHITYPRLDDPQAAYSDLDEASWQAKYGPIDAGRLKHDRHQNYQEEVATIRAYVPDSDAAILDVGCHSGWLLGYLQQSGYENLEGVEPTPFLASVARRRLDIPVHEMYLQDLTDRTAAFDAIIATDVIEHVNPEDQASFITAIHTLLKPDGYVFIKTPNVHFTKLKADISERLPEFVKQRLLMHRDLWDAKEHVVLWDAQTLQAIFEKHAFEIVRTFVPMLVQTRNSPFLARLARDTLYISSYLIGGKTRIPAIAQDIFLVARKTEH